MSENKENKSRDVNIKKFNGDVLAYIEKSGIPFSKFILMACEEKIERDKK